MKKLTLVTVVIVLIGMGCKKEIKRPSKPVPQVYSIIIPEQGKIQTEDQGVVGNDGEGKN